MKLKPYARFHMYIFTFRVGFFAVANILAAKLHSKRILCDARLVHCNRCCIEISFQPSAGIRPNVLVIFHIRDCTLAICIASICNNFEQFSLWPFDFDCDCDLPMAVSVMH